MADGGFGQRLGEYARLEEVPTVSAGLLRTAEFSASRLHWDERPEPEPFDIASEDAFLIFLTRRYFPTNPYRVDGRPVPLQPRTAGQFTLHDLRRSQVAEVQAACDCLALHVPIAGLQAVSDDLRVRRVADLRAPAGAALDDPVVRHLGESLVPALGSPRTSQPLYVEHVGLALATHILQRYGDVDLDESATMGGLAPWQVRRTKDLLMANIEGQVSLSELAAACRLSRSHFARAFKVSTGVAPHRWLSMHRVKLAKALLTSSSKSLDQIADECGFADQSHFSRTFSRAVGVPPGRWRRERRW